VTVTVHEHDLRLTLDGVGCMPSGEVGGDLVDV
jgi:hypothetical protein